MECNVFRDYFCCPKGHSCENSYIKQAGKLGAVLFNQNEMILSQLYQMNCREPSSGIKNPGKKGKSGKDDSDTTSRVKKEEIDLKVKEIEKKLDISIIL